MNLTDRLITAIVEKCDGLAITAEQASNILAYLQYAAPLPREAATVPTAAARDVLAERQRQATAEGWTPEHDDGHAAGDIAIAAACYAANAGGVPWSGETPSFWPWCNDWWKPTTPRRDLVKAGALILAEIERIDRAAPAAASNGEQ